jgi:hypothetical protein
MNRHRQILLLRLSYWVGAVIDGFVAVQLLLPDFWVNFNGLTTAPTATLNYALGVASALMWGWTALLIWADRKPLERKGILLLTTFPVVFGLAANNVYIAISGVVTVQSVLPSLAIQCILTALFLFSYVNARKETP